MLNCVSHLNGSHIIATNGARGHVKEVYLEDLTWTIRYLVVHTGAWISGRDVVISPDAVKQVPQTPQALGYSDDPELALTRQQVENRLAMDSPHPLLYSPERGYLRYYADTHCLQEGCVSVSGLGAAENAHLRNSVVVMGYGIQASDGRIGYVRDLVFDDVSWLIRYVVMDAPEGWGGGQKRLLTTDWIDRVDWADKTVFTQLTREQIKSNLVSDELIAGR